MKRLTVIVAAIAVLAAPAGAAAAKPTKAEKQHAQQECRAERGTTDASRQAFRNKYGTNANKKNAFGKCVSQKTRDDS